MLYFKTIQLIRSKCQSNLQQLQLLTLHHQTVSRVWTRCSLSSEWQSCRQSQSCTVFISSLLFMQTALILAGWLAGSADSQPNTSALRLPGLLLDRYIRAQTRQTPILAFCRTSASCDYSMMVLLLRQTLFNLSLPSMPSCKCKQINYWHQILVLAFKNQFLSPYSSICLMGGAHNLNVLIPPLSRLVRDRDWQVCDISGGWAVSCSALPANQGSGSLPFCVLLTS